jgi:ADP-dependent NAD(P)H-hydrate dehydratase
VILRLQLKNQESNVYKLSRKYGITIILKGYNTIVCEGDSRGNNHHQKHHRAVIRRTTPAMTVGGCGDILSGVMASLLRKMQDTFSASIAGVYLCGIAGSLAYQRVGLHMVETDLIEELPNAMKAFDKIN